MHYWQNVTGADFALLRHKEETAAAAEVVKPLPAGPTFARTYFVRPDAMAACISAAVKRSTFLSATNKLTASFNSC